MAASRRSPTPVNYGPEIPDDQYAIDIDEEISALWGCAAETLGSVAGINAITATCTPTLTTYSRKLYILTPANANTTSVTLTIDGVGVKDLKTQAGSAFVGGELAPNVPTLIYDAGAEFRMAFTAPAGTLPALPLGYISPNGLIVGNNVSDSNNDIDVSVGHARDSTNTVNIVGGAMVKRLDAPWVAGTTNGGMLMSANQTGTVSVTSSGTSVTGTGTSFSSIFQVGDVITTAAGQPRRITVVGSNTSLTVTPAWSSTETGVTFKRGGKAFSMNGPAAYRIFALYHDSTGAVDYAASTRDTPVDLPAGYSFYRLIDYILTDSSANNVQRKRTGDLTELIAPISDFSGTVDSAVVQNNVSAAPPNVIANFSLTGSLTVQASSDGLGNKVGTLASKVYAVGQSAASVPRGMACVSHWYESSGIVVSAACASSSSVSLNASAQYGFTKESVTVAIGGSISYAVTLNGWRHQR